MLHVITLFIFSIIFSLNSLAGSLLRNTKQIKELIGNSDLIVIGTLKDSEVIAKYSSTSMLKKKQHIPNMYSAIFTGSVTLERILINSRKVVINQELSVLWFDYINSKTDYITQLTSSFCPPISLQAYSKHNIWFLRSDHGIWRIESNQPISLEKHIDEYIQTGSAKELDIEYLKWLNSPNAEDPFAD